MVNVEELMVGNVVSTNGTPCNTNVGGRNRLRRYTRFK